MWRGTSSFDQRRTRRQALRSSVIKVAFVETVGRRGLNKGKKPL